MTEPKAERWVDGGTQEGEGTACLSCSDGGKVFSSWMLGETPGAGDFTNKTRNAEKEEHGLVEVARGPGSQGTLGLH